MSESLSTSAAGAFDAERIQPAVVASTDTPDAPLSRLALDTLSRSSSSQPSWSIVRTASSSSGLDSQCPVAVCASPPSELEMRKKTTMTMDIEGTASPTTTKGWSFEGLLALGMEPVQRVTALQDIAILEAIIREAEAAGMPLIVEDWHKSSCWPQDGLFGFDWLLEHGEQDIAVRDCVSRKDKKVPFREFIEKSRAISEYAVENETERLYGKDAVCPLEWRDWLSHSNLPCMLKPGGPEDLLEILPESERVETLMCYHGVGDTFTAAHKDLCASSGQNLMCAAENGGSAFWFMARSSDAPHAASFFRAWGTELDHEARVASPEELASAPFKVFVAEQRVGDLVLVPRRSCHQVVNHGGLTTKMSWSRMTIDGLVTAFHHELPIYRRVCRPETYRVKLLTYRALLKYTADLKNAQAELIANARTAKLNTPLNESFSTNHFLSSPLTSPLSSPESSSSRLPLPLLTRKSPTLSSRKDNVVETRVPLSAEHSQLIESVRRLLLVFEKILKEEHQGATQCELRLARAPDTSGGTLTLAHPLSTRDGVPPIPAPEQVHRDGLSCDFCGADIFQSFFECKCCATAAADNFDPRADLLADPLADPRLIAGAEIDNFVICPGCYVEGRSCQCSVMTPVQRYPMDMLLRAQNEAGELLNFPGYGKKGHADVVRVVALSHQAIHNVVGDHPGIFSVACQLLRTRIAGLSKRPDRMCQKQGTHLVPAAGALSCKLCHSSRCFRHILNDGFHVSEALASYIKDDSHGTWHDKHKGSTQREKRRCLEEKQQAAREAEARGDACDMHVSLTLHAQMYSECQPLSEKVRAGWYDDASCLNYETPPGSCGEGFLGAVLGEDDTASVISISRPASPESSGDILRPTFASAIPSKKPTATAKPHSRQILDFIFVPALSDEERSKYFKSTRVVSNRIKPLTASHLKHVESQRETMNGSFYDDLASAYMLASRLPSIAPSRTRKASVTPTTTSSSTADSIEQLMQKELAAPKLSSTLIQRSSKSSASAMASRMTPFTVEDAAQALLSPSLVPLSLSTTPSLPFRALSETSPVSSVTLPAPTPSTAHLSPYPLVPARTSPIVPATVVHQKHATHPAEKSTRPTRRVRQKIVLTEDETTDSSDDEDKRDKEPLARLYQGKRISIVQVTQKEKQLGPLAFRNSKKTSGRQGGRVDKVAKGKKSVKAKPPSQSAKLALERPSHSANSASNHSTGSDEEVRRERDMLEDVLKSMNEVRDSKQEEIKYLREQNESLLRRQEYHSQKIEQQDSLINSYKEQIQMCHKLMMQMERQALIGHTTMQGDNFAVLGLGNHGKHLHTPYKRHEHQWKTRDGRQAFGRHQPWSERERRYYGDRRGEPSCNDYVEQQPQHVQPQQRKRKRRWDEGPDGRIRQWTPGQAYLEREKEREQGQEAQTRRYLTFDDYRNRRDTMKETLNAPRFPAGDGAPAQSLQTRPLHIAHSPTPVPRTAIPRPSAPSASADAAEFIMEINPVTYAASQAANHDDDVVANPWMGYRPHF